MASSRIFVKGIPPNITEADFRKHFSTGNREVTDVKIIPQRRIGYVGYKTADEASKAIKYFNKSYIRMSKISVESARPISEQAPTRTSHSGANSQVLSGKRKAPERTAEDPDEGLQKKKKRGDDERPDPKLEEFLQVMGRGQESLMGAVTSTGEEVPDSEAHQVPVPEAESDDEYEAIPSRKGKEVSRAQPEKAVNPPSRIQAVTAKNKEAESTHEPERSEPETMVVDDEATAGPAPKASAVANDDDWLRSRTNRLLDLMDPDDLPQERIDAREASVPEPTPDDRPKQKETANETGEGVTTTDLEHTATETEAAAPDSLDLIRRTSRLFVRNLPYGATEDDIRECFEKFGAIEEVHLPTSKAGSKKGFALLLFADPSQAVEAFQSMDGATFQGRLLHIIPADAKREAGLDEFALSKLPLKKQNMLRKKAEAASNTFNWNSLYMNQDAVNTSVANRLGVSKSELLDPTSSDAAVKQAIAETSVIQETKAYFVANGVDLEAFKSHKRGDTAILVKNFPHGTTMEELRTLFEEGGPVLRVLMPPSGTIAIVEYAQPNQAKAAFGKLAYRRIKDSVLFLEKAPKDLFTGETQAKVVVVAPSNDRPTGTQKLNVDDLLTGGDKAEEVVDTTSLFVRNLNFETTTSRLAEACSSIDGFVSARVKTKADPKKPGQTLSMGFGFVEFRSKVQAQEALKVLDGYVLDNHTLSVKASHRGLDAAEERRRDDRARKAASKRTKIIIKNLPFQATKKDVRALFGTYGQLRSVRVPKKADYTARGFAFADFVTPREAENALNALRDTHLLGRKLVLDYAEAEALDAEEEIEKMQRKVGGQANKMALQQLTGGGRQKVNIGDNEEDGEG